MTEPPVIVGVDIARKPDRSAIMRWDGAAHLVHELPTGASVTFFGERIVVVHPNGPPYEVNPHTGAVVPIDLNATFTERQSDGASDTESDGA